MGNPLTGPQGSPGPAPRRPRPRPRSAGTSCAGTKTMGSTPSQDGDVLEWPKEEILIGSDAIFTPFGTLRAGPRVRPRPALHQRTAAGAGEPDHPRLGDHPDRDRSAGDRLRPARVRRHQDHRADREVRAPALQTARWSPRSTPAPAPSSSTCRRARPSTTSDSPSATSNPRPATSACRSGAAWDSTRPGWGPTPSTWPAGRCSTPRGSTRPSPRRRRRLRQEAAGGRQLRLPDALGHRGAVPIPGAATPTAANPPVTLENVTVHSSPSSGVSLIECPKVKQDGLVNEPRIDNFRIYPEEQQDLVSTNADGIRSSRSRVGPNVTNCDLERMADDGINLTSDARVFQLYVGLNDAVLRLGEGVPLRLNDVARDLRPPPAPSPRRPSSTSTPRSAVQRTTAPASSPVAPSAARPGPRRDPRLEPGRLQPRSPGQRHHDPLQPQLRHGRHGPRHDRRGQHGGVVPAARASSRPTSTPTTSAARVRCPAASRSATTTSATAATWPT